MREIELKFKVDNIDDIISFLEKSNCEISDTECQYDTIYVQNLDNVESTEGSVWLRVRKTNDKIELNYKKQSAKKWNRKKSNLKLILMKKLMLF